MLAGYFVIEKNKSSVAVNAALRMAIICYNAIFSTSISLVYATY